MQRNVSMDEISDGKLYGLNDMVKAECGDCKGCHTCCTGMGSSIVLDPLDIHNLKKATGLSFEGLLAKHIELNVCDGIILPNLRMNDKDECTFIDENGRCRVHKLRPGICRLFPLGRVYEDGDFKYFLQVNECVNNNRTKVKVKKWIDIDDIPKNQAFIRDWHYFIKDVGAKNETVFDEETAKKVSLIILRGFFAADFGENFYEEFDGKLKIVKDCLSNL